MQTCLFSSRQNRLSALNYLPVLSQPRRLCPNYQSALNYLSVPSRPWRSILNCLPVLLRPRRPFMNSLTVPVMAMEVVPELFVHPELSVYPVRPRRSFPFRQRSRKTPSVMNSHPASLSPHLPSSAPLPLHPTSPSAHPQLYICGAFGVYCLFVCLC